MIRRLGRSVTISPPPPPPPPRKTRQFPRGESITDSTNRDVVGMQRRRALPSPSARPGHAHAHHLTLTTQTQSPSLTLLSLPLYLSTLLLLLLLLSSQHLAPLTANELTKPLGLPSV